MDIKSRCAPEMDAPKKKKHVMGFVSDTNVDWFGEEQGFFTAILPVPTSEEPFRPRDAKLPKRDVMGFQNPPGKIQPGECPMGFVDGERNADGTMKPVHAVELSTQGYGNYTVLCGNHRGHIRSYQLPNESAGTKAPAKFTHLGGRFYQGEDGYYWQDAKGNFTPMTDFFVKVTEHQQRKAVDGTISEVFVVSICDTGDWEQKLEIPYEKWADLFDYIRKRAPDRLIASDDIQKESFRILASHLLKKSKPPITVVTSYWGWGEPQTDGSRKFRHGGLPDCNAPKKLLPPIMNREYLAQRLRKALDVVKVGSIEFTMPIFVHSAASYLDALFTDAGFFLSHSIMAIGDSGFKKTSYVKVVCAPFCPEKDRVVSIRCTEAALYVLLEMAYDDTFVIDDFNREESEQATQQKQKNIRIVFRMRSDRTPRQKWTGMNETKGCAIRGGCIVTGETKMVGSLKSGELRYVKVYLLKPISGRLLKVYQDDPTLMQEFFSEWIRFLEAHYVDIVAWIKGEFEARREAFSELREPRLIDACVHLTLTADLLGEFMLESNAMSLEECAKWQETFRDVIFDILRRQRDEIQDKEPVLQYVEEIWSLIGTGKILIAPDITIYARNLSSYSGYTDGDIIMLKKDDIHVAVTTAFKVRGDYFTGSIEDMAKELKRRGLTRHDADGCLKRASSKIAGRPRMLALIKSKCEEILEVESNGNGK